MAINPIPPQAYTKDAVVKAYSWLQHQDNSIKEMATTTDILVSLYLKATRDGDAALDRPSIQNFKHELKQLAGLMGEFEKVSAPPPQAVTASTSTGPALNSAGVSPNQNLGHQVVENSAENRTSANVIETSQNYKAVANRMVNKGHDLNVLDEHSLRIVAEVRNKLNLSSDSEAFKMLIQIGFNKIKKLL